MKVFNEEINNCADCKYSDMYNQECNFTDYIKLKEGMDVNYFKEIHFDCPFNKPVTKQDIEDFGFVFTTKSIDDWYYKEGEYETEQFNTNRFYKLQLQFSRKDEICKICAIDTDNSEYILFNGKISSKPHLEFILKSLNII